jgi:glycosyltransferase involved in cell wall biosynthesis
MSPRVIPTVPISFLMPVCNEVDVVGEVVGEWQADVLNHLEAGYELIFHDSSDDGTTEILMRLGENDPRVKVIHAEKRGFFVAAKALYEAARFPVVFFTDSDGQYVAEDFWNLTPFLDEHDIVHGTKTGRKDPCYRLAASVVFNWLTRAYFGSRCNDVNSAFRLVKRPVLDTILPRIRHLPTLLNAEMLIRSEKEGRRIKNVPVRHRARRFGKSRGIAPGVLWRECRRAFRGLLALRQEYRRP